MCHLLLFFTTAVTVAKINITCVKFPCDISLLVFFHDNTVKMANINITCLRVTVWCVLFGFFNDSSQYGLNWHKTNVFPTSHNNNYIYIFRNIKTPNYVLFLLCVCLIYQSWRFVLLMMPHVGPMIRQYNIFYSIHSIILGERCCVKCWMTELSISSFWCKILSEKGQ